MKEATRVKLMLLAKYKKGDFRSSFTLGAATVVVGVRGETLLIGSLHVPRGCRKRGVGTRALRAVLRACDDAGIACTLRVAPFDGGTSVDRLRTWYAGHGFRVTKGRYMRRDPKPGRAK